MLRVCSICGKEFERKGSYRSISMVPNIDSLECFKVLLKHDKTTFKDIERIASENKFTIQPTLELEPYRSKVEIRFAEFLKRNKIKFKYEPYGFIHRKFVDDYNKHNRWVQRLYLPDFFLTEYNIFLEIKLDKWEHSSFSKAKHFAKYFPFYAIDHRVFELLTGKKKFGRYGWTD